MDWALFTSRFGIAVFAMLQPDASIVCQLIIFLWNFFAL
jgi:hypothetical protein